MSWVVETLNDTVDDELAALPVDVRARFVRIAELIEAVGVPNVGEPHVKHLSASVGDPPERKEWHRQGSVCDGAASTGGGPTRIRQEVAEDAH